MATSRTKEYAQALLEMTDGASAEESKKALKEFAAYLAKKGKLGEADAILEAYGKLYNQKHEILEATVTLLNRLPEKDKAALAESLKRKYKAREVHIVEKVDERILGGMKIRIGDEIYDSTLQNSLKQLETALLK